MDTITSRGFDPRATAIAARTAGSCYQMQHRPDDRLLAGLAVFSVTPSGDGFLFDAETRALRDGERPAVLLGWLEDRIPAEGAVISWDRRLSLPKRLTSLAGEGQPRIRAAAADTSGRWRDLPRWTTWHLRHARVDAVPCLCVAGDPGPCRTEIPQAFLPDPALTEQTLIDEAMRGWATWARSFPDCDDPDRPAQQALAAARRWAAARAAAAG